MVEMTVVVQDGVSLSPKLIYPEIPMSVQNMLLQAQTSPTLMSASTDHVSIEVFFQRGDMNDQDS